MLLRKELAMRNRIAFAVLVVLLGSSKLFAQESESLKKPIIVFSAAAAADWITTYRSHSTFRNCTDHFCGGAREERNVLISNIKQPAKMVLAGAAIDAASIFLVNKMLGKKHPRVARALFYGAAAYRGFLAARNETTLRSSQARANELNAIYGAR